MASVGSDPIGIKHTGAQEYAHWLSRRTGNMYQGLFEVLYKRVRRTLE